MGSRTYLPTLVVLGRLVRTYCARNDAKIRLNMSSEVQTLYDALLAALDALLASIVIDQGD
jgi:hypothetical protein